MAAIDQLQKLLESIKGPNDQSLRDHLLNVFSQIVYNRPSDVITRFEEISSQVKFTGLQFNSPSAYEWGKIHQEQLVQWIAKMRNLLDKPKEENEDGELVEAEAGPVAYAPDLYREREILRWAGIDFGEEEVIALQNSLKKLVRDKAPREIRFWGKISGTNSDYYIIEGQGDAPEDEEERGADFEKRGEGINTYTYWVTNDPLAEWFELPDITPQQLGVARKIRKLFSGNLEANVVSNPYFPGKEKHLLRAQIARITHATTLVPKGQWKENEDDPTNIDAEEEPRALEGDEWGDMGNWQHYLPNILYANRIVHMEPEIPEDEEIDPEEVKAKMLADDPLVPRLRPINRDEPLPGFSQAWSIRTVGDEQKYKAAPPSQGFVSYSYIILRSLWWPGFSMVINNGQYLPCYVGDGLKAPVIKYFPIYMPNICDDPDDLPGQPEPTPLEAPPAPEEQENQDDENDQT